MIQPLPTPKIYRCIRSKRKNFGGRGVRIGRAITNSESELEVKENFSILQPCYIGHFNLNDLDMLTNAGRKLKK